MCHYKKNNIIVKKLKDLFDGSKSCFSREALSIMASFNLHNYGGSDEATEMIIAGTLKALFFEIGFKVSPVQLSKGCPSQRTIARAEFNLAGDALIKVLWEMKKDGVKRVGMMTDHGHRAGQDHFVVIFVWVGKDEHGNPTVKTFCPSIDKAGHTTEAAAKGVEAIVKRFLGENVEVVEVFTILGDAGGGGAVHYIHPKLVDMEVMDKQSKMANCSLHGMQNSLKAVAKI